MVRVTIDKHNGNEFIKCWANPSEFNLCVDGINHVIKGTPRISIRK